MNTNNQGNFEFLELISIISFSLQLMVLSETRNQSTTDDIFYELKQQDTRYLKRLLEGQQKILDKLAVKHILKDNLFSVICETVTNVFGIPYSSPCHVYLPACGLLCFRVFTVTI